MTDMVVTRTGNRTQKRTTPLFVQTLERDQVFVFGSNLRGIHRIGAALVARVNFGYPAYHGEGYARHCYAIPTCSVPGKPLRFTEIQTHVERFLSYATQHPELCFLVTPVGCGFAGYTAERIAPLFARAAAMQNVCLPEKFWRVLGDTPRLA